MNAIDDSLATVATVGNEFEAQLLVNLLKDEGIAARATGFWTSQFRAEAPGSIRVVVNFQSLAAARSAVSHAHVEPPASADQDGSAIDRSGLRRMAIWTAWAFLVLIVGAIVAWL
jgi:hypothetical protein